MNYTSPYPNDGWASSILFVFKIVHHSTSRVRILTASLMIPKVFFHSKLKIERKTSKTSIISFCIDDDSSNFLFMTLP